MRIKAVGSGESRWRLTSVAASAPAAICPGAPMLKSPARSDGVRPAAMIAIGANRRRVSPNARFEPSAPSINCSTAAYGSAPPMTSRTAPKTRSDRYR